MHVHIQPDPDRALRSSFEDGRRVGDMQAALLMEVSALAA